MGIASQIATGIVNARSYSQMQESEQRYRLLAENVKDIIWIMDVETLKMKYINPSIETVTGFSPEEFMDMSIDQYLSPASFEQAASALSGALEQAMTGAIDPENFSMTMELEEYHKNGAIIPVEVTAGFLVDENGSPNAVLGISRDLSDRKNAENERAEIESRLQQAKKMESLGTMAGSIAHNFNNLLMVVLGNLEIAIEDLPQESATASQEHPAGHQCIPAGSGPEQHDADLCGPVEKRERSGGLVPYGQGRIEEYGRIQDGSMWFWTWIWPTPCRWWPQTPTRCAR